MVTADSQVLIAPMRPAFEGANIRTWIGFKHLMYMTEQAVLEWFRKYAIGPQQLYDEYGLGLEILDSSVQLPALVYVDDLIIAEVSPKGGETFSVKLRAQRGSEEPVVVQAKVKVGLLPHGSPAHTASAPESIAPFILAALPAPATANSGILETPAAFAWSWKARYFHCHYTGRVQHSAYVRALEEVVDRFLEHRGISIRRMLDDRAWIPVVSRARVRLTGEARMDDTVQTTFTVLEVLKNLAFEARMDCHILRGSARVLVSTASILHGYAIASGEQAGKLAQLDLATLAALGLEAHQ